MGVEILESICAGRPVEGKTVVSPPFVLGRTMVF
jgi:hypothetical protein